METKTKPIAADNKEKRKKTGGRKKGVPNKTTGELKALVHELVSENIDAIRKNFNTLDDEMKFVVILKLLPYVLPKQSENKITLDEETTKAIQDSMNKINSLF